MLLSPNLREDDRDLKEGVLLEFDAVELNLSDDDIARAVGNRVDFSKSWWNKNENLETVQRQAENIWLNLVSDDLDLYEYIEPYKENRIFLAIETLISQAVGNPPQPLVREAYDEDASRELAMNVEKVLLAYYETLHQHAQMQMVARHLLTGFRYAVVKLRFDNSIGRRKKNVQDGDNDRSGGIVTEVVRPDKVIFDAGATNKGNIPLIAEYLEDSTDSLCNMYPEKQSEIMVEVGMSYGTAVQTSQLIQYLEIHFTGWMPDTGKEYEGITHKLNRVVLDKMKNPNFNYDEFGEDRANPQTGEPEVTYNNFFDKPKKPYIIFNYLNQGKYIVDSTSLTEQTAQLQRHLEQRGRQISVNADMANAGWIFNSNMVTEEKVAELIGDPDEKLMVKGDVTKAAMKLQAAPLPDYVIEDKADLRGAIDTIFGANAPLVGEKSGNDTLGQDVLSVQRNTSRLGTLVTCLEDGWTEVYKYEVQLMKVFFNEPDMVKYDGPEGKTAFVNFSNQNIESGISLKIKSGSLLPDDPATQLQIAEKFAESLDPLNLAEYLGMDDPKKSAEQLTLWSVDKAAYMKKYLGMDPGGDFDQDAVNDIQQISQGQQVTPPASPSSSYVGQIQSFIGSPAFKKMGPIHQAQMRAHAQATSANAQKRLGINQQQKVQNDKKGFLSKIAEGAKRAFS